MLPTTDVFMDSNIGPLNPRIVLSHLDVSTQADIQAASSSDYEDEMRRIHNENAHCAAHYSKQDIKEQYCISNKGLGALENDKQFWFGCLSSRHTSCSNRSSLLTACVRQKVPSDENLYELYKRYPSEYAPYPRLNRNPWGPFSSQIYDYDENLRTSYFRRKAQADPNGYTWMTTDDESVKMEKPKSIAEYSGHHQRSAMCHSMAASKKHVSFARSHTLASFDDAISSLSALSTDVYKTRQEERLLDVRKNEMLLPITKQPEPENIVIMDKIKRTPTKTKATQTEIWTKTGRKPLPLNVVSSPRVKMVSQEAQTNGFVFNGRKLTKSFSEAGDKFGVSNRVQDDQYDTLLNHEPLQRTQSDEPPRSPFIVSTPPLPVFEPIQQLSDSDTSSLSKSDPETDESGQSKKEIFIDFKPQISQKKSKKLTKTLSDGEILSDKRKMRDIEEKPGKSWSVSHENLQEDQKTSFTPYFQKVPIKYEGIYKPFDENICSSYNGVISVQDSVDEEFHENLIYNEIYLGVDDENKTSINDADLMHQNNVSYVSASEDKENQKSSPFASNDSLTNDIRDQLDDIWNESQSTVLQIDSGTDSGTLLSSSELNSATTPNSSNLTASRRKLLLLQRQQRSSIDTETLDEEVVDINSTNSPVTVERPTPSELSQPSRQYLSVQKSYTWKSISDAPSESPVPAVVPDLLLARTDSCKTNTDVSESTTTEDYMTANSGTDSSRKSGSLKGSDRNNGGAGFKRHLLEDMVVPVDEIFPHSDSCCNTPVPIRTGRSTPSEYSSSSCGSYSVGSIPDLLEKSKVPTAKSEKILSDEKVFEKSSFRNNPPANDHLIWKYSKYETSKNNMKNFSVDQHIYSETYVVSRKFKTSKKDASLTELNTNLEHERSPGSKPQSQRKGLSTKKLIYKRPFLYDEKEERLTSDESSCDLKQFNDTSPRKIKKCKEGFRRKSLPRSPVRNKSFDEKPSSLPNSLSRKKCLKGASKRIENKRFSPINLPQDIKKIKKCAGANSKLKALSAESLRSVSPGSDSVFYSDLSNQAENHIHCLHCGKEVDVFTTVDSYKNCINKERHTIVQPPAEFGDSPRGSTQGRLYKSLERRIRSEERSPLKHGKHTYKADRAKSEERGGKQYKNKLRPMAKSTTNSQEQLNVTNSSPSVLPGAPDQDDDNGVYDVPYSDGSWIHIDEREEFTTNNATQNTSTEKRDRNGSFSSTESEKEFRKRYQAITHRMVHRKSCIEMYKRLHNQSFDAHLDTIELRCKLEETFKILLVIWCQQNRALNATTLLKNDCDKTVLVYREAGEFGFRIHGSKPVVVSAIEPGTPAETSGLEVGDIVLSVNGVNVLEKTHSEVVKIAHAGSDTLKLEVVRTCYAFSPPCDKTSKTLYSGYLWKMKGYASGSTTNKWKRRWFCLRENNCLYYYKTDIDRQPVGVITLADHEIKTLESSATEESAKPYQFKIQRADEMPLYLAADTGTAQERWTEVIEKAIRDCQQADNFLDETKKNVTLPPNAISQPDCFGYLVKLGTQWKSWSRRYCVLKDACLYFYCDVGAKSAFGVVYLQGYRVQQSISGSKNHTFELIPPDSNKKWYSFQAESESDRKRWIAALEYSIDRWLKINTNHGS